MHLTVGGRTLYYKVYGTKEGAIILFTTDLDVQRCGRISFPG